MRFETSIKPLPLQYRLYSIGYNVKSVNGDRAAQIHNKVTFSLLDINLKTTITGEV